MHAKLTNIKKIFTIIAHYSLMMWKPKCCSSIEKNSSPLSNIRTSLLLLYTDQFASYIYWTFSYDMVKSCNGNSFPFPQLYSYSHTFIPIPIPMI